MSQSSVSQLLYLIFECDQLKEDLTRKDLSKLVIEMDNELYNLSEVVVGKIGIITPELEKTVNNLEAYKLLSIKQGNIRTTKKADSYLIDSCITPEFIGTVTNVIISYYKSKHYLENLVKK